MAELALRTTEFINKKQYFIAYRPIGSVIIAVNQPRMRRKWLEIVCDLVSPKKRDQYQAIPGWKYLCEYWTPQLREEWIQLQKPSELYPHGQLLQVPISAQTMWNERVESGLIALIGKELHGIEDITNTWLWSESERKIYFIVINEDETDNQKIAGWAGFNQIMLAGEVYEIPRTQVKYKTDIGLSAGTLNDIANRNKTMHPRFDKPIKKVKINSPKLQGIN